MVVLQGHPLPHRAEVVAEVERVRGRLDAGQHPRASLGSHGAHSPRRFRPGGHRLALVEVITVGPGLAARSFPGDGRPVLLVHGLSSNARLWDAVARHLAGHPVVAVDLRGHGALRPGARRRAGRHPGRRPRPRRRCATTSAGRAPVVAGQSWGGNVVLQLAAIGRCTGSRWSTGGGCSSPTASPRSTTLGPSSRRRRSTGSPPRPSAPGSASAHPGLVGRGGRGHGGQPADPRRRHGRALAHPRTAPRDRRQHARAPAAELYAQVELPGAAPGRGGGQPGGEPRPRRRSRTPSWSRSPAATTTCTPNTREEVAALIGRLV